MNVPCACSLLRAGVVAFLCGPVAPVLGGQTYSPDSSTHLARGQTAWVSVGFGVSQLGYGGQVSGWYGHNKLVVGGQYADAAELFGPDVHAASLLVGARVTSRHSQTLFAIGPARLGAWHIEPGGSFLGHTVVEKNEIGVGAAAEGVLHLGFVGLGVDMFAAGSGHHSLVGATLSVQLGWLGK